jgi:type I restriction enzyme M protein
MARIMDPQPGMDVYDPCCGSAGLLIKCRLVLDGKRRGAKKGSEAPLKLYGQENEPGTWAMANMNMIIHDMEGEIQIGDTFRKPKFRQGNRLQTFDRVVANPMWNQTEFREKDYDADELDRFPKGAGYPGGKADWGWLQHILASLKPAGRAAVVLDTGAASRGSGNANSNKEKEVRQWFVDQDVIEGVIYLPENLFYNTAAPGVVIFLNKVKPKDRQGKMFLLNASREFVKGEPKNYLPEDSIARIAATFTAWKEIEKYSRIIARAEIAKNDFNISPTRYIRAAEGQEYRPIAEIVEELEALEVESAMTDAALKTILRNLDV